MIPQTRQLIIYSTSSSVTDRKRQLELNIFGTNRQMTYNCVGKNGKSILNKLPRKKNTAHQKYHKPYQKEWIFPPGHHYKEITVELSA